jgi:hypothetical protein
MGCDSLVEPNPDLMARTRQATVTVKRIEGMLQTSGTEMVFVAKRHVQRTAKDSHWHESEQRQRRWQGG